MGHSRQLHAGGRKHKDHDVQTARAQSYVYGQLLRRPRAMVTFGQNEKHQGRRPPGMRKPVRQLCRRQKIP